MNTSMTGKPLGAAFPTARGLTLVEILVALLVLSIGLLGLAALQNTSLRFNTSAYYRTQATALAYDVVDRMRANRRAALDGAYTVDFQDPAPACETIALGVGSIAEQDIAAWRDALACRIPQSTGSIVPDGNEVTITVRWDDNRGNDVDNIDFQLTTAL